jgi:hypothetical protein
MSQSEPSSLASSAKMTVVGKMAQMTVDGVMRTMDGFMAATPIGAYPAVVPATAAPDGARGAPPGLAKAGSTAAEDELRFAYDGLRTLERLHTEGAITAEEFDQA